MIRESPGKIETFPHSILGNRTTNRIHIPLLRHIPRCGNSAPVSPIAHDGKTWYFESIRKGHKWYT